MCTRNLIKIAMLATGLVVAGCAYPRPYYDNDRGGPVYYEPVRPHHMYRSEPVPYRHHYERHVEPSHYYSHPRHEYREREREHHHRDHDRDWDRDRR